MLWLVIERDAWLLSRTLNERKTTSTFHLSANMRARIRSLSTSVIAGISQTRYYTVCKVRGYQTGDILSSEPLFHSRDSPDRLLCSVVSFASGNFRRQFFPVFQFLVFCFVFRPSVTVIDRFRITLRPFFLHTAESISRYDISAFEFWWTV